MAPEILNKEAYIKKIDIWGIRVIENILLCGCPPFDGESEERFIEAIQTREPNFGSKRIKKQLSKEAVENSFPALSARTKLTDRTLLTYLSILGCSIMLEKRN